MCLEEHQLKEIRATGDARQRNSWAACLPRKPDTWLVWVGPLPLFSSPPPPPIYPLSFFPASSPLTDPTFLMPLWHCVTVTLFGWTPGYISNVNVWLSVWLSDTRDDLDQVKYWWDDSIAEDVKSRQMQRVIAVLCRLWLLWLSVARGRGRRMFWGDDCLCIFFTSLYLSTSYCCLVFVMGEGKCFRRMKGLLSLSLPLYLSLYLPLYLSLCLYCICLCHCVLDCDRMSQREATGGCCEIITRHCSSSTHTGKKMADNPPQQWIISVGNPVILWSTHEARIGKK